MSVTASDLVTLAQDLLNTKNEAAHRAAMSRGYYAAFHACKAWHDRLPAPGAHSGTAGGVHQAMVNRLANPSPETKIKTPDRVTQSRRLSAMLNTAKTKRKLADYDLDEHISEAEAQTFVADCQRMLTEAQ